MPEVDAKADYSGRKQEWSLSIMIVTYDKAMICYFHAGFSGTAHNNRIQERTKLNLNREIFPSAVEYLLGDTTAFE